LNGQMPGPGAQQNTGKAIGFGNARVSAPSYPFGRSNELLAEAARVPAAAEEC